MAKPKGTGLSWRQAWFELLNGRKIKLPSWKGYWKWENNTIMIHLSDGTVMDIRETENPAYTFTNIAENCWMIVSDDYEIYNKLDNQTDTDDIGDIAITENNISAVHVEKALEPVVQDLEKNISINDANTYQHLSQNSISDEKERCSNSETVLNNKIDDTEKHSNTSVNDIWY